MNYRLAWFVAAITYLAALLMSNPAIAIEQTEENLTQRQLEVETETEVSAEVGVEAEVNTEVNTEVGAEVSTEVGVEAETDVSAEAGVEAEVNTEVGVEAEGDPDIEAGIESNAGDSQMLTQDEAAIPQERLDQIKLDQLGVLATSGQYDDGYTLSQSLIEQWEGEPSFDFYYGLHALGTGHFDEATFVFERLTALNPNTLRYRLELARALYFNNNLPQAKAEFELALQANPPPKVKSNIHSFLRRINLAQPKKRHTLQIATSLTYGYDSNINNGTEEDIVEASEIVIELDEDSQSMESSFSQLSTKMYYSYGFNRHQNIDVALNTSHKRNEEVSTYDLDIINAFMGYSWQSGALRIQPNVSIAEVQLDGEDYLSQSLYGVNGLYTGTKYGVLGIGMSSGEKKSLNDNVPDADLFILSLSVNRQGNRHGYQNISGYYGSENVSDSNLEHFGKTYYGLAYSVRNVVTPKLARTLYVTAQTNRFQSETPVFNEIRSETAISANFGYEWVPKRYFSWGINGIFSYNASNIDLYVYNRAVISTSINLQF